MTTLDVGVIGNCRIASLVDKRGAHVWTCMPQLDSDPVFCNLLRNGDQQDAPGIFDVELLEVQKLPKPPPRRVILPSWHN